MPLGRLLWQADSAFPGGSFGFSNGMEALAAAGTVVDAASLAQTLVLLLSRRWAPFDRIALASAHRATPDLALVAACDRLVDVSSLIAPFRLGSARNGRAFLTTHARLETAGAADYLRLLRRGAAPGHLAIVQGLVWCGLGIALDEAIALSHYATAASLTQAAVRLGVIGAIEAQRALVEALDATAGLAVVPGADEALSSFTPFADIIAQRHMRADVRFFAN